MAFAADLPSRRLAPPPSPVPAFFSWNGFYIGANAGYAFESRADFQTFNGPGSGRGVPADRPAFAQQNQQGFTAGGQIGYNYELGDLLHLGPAGSGVVVGVEADAVYTDLRGTQEVILGAIGLRENLLHSRLDFLGTARGRLGYAFDRVMIYGTGGFAYGETDNASVFETAGVPGYAGNRSGFSTGYVFGGGIEYALPTETFLNVFHSSAVTIKGEFLHYDLGAQTYAVGGTGIIAAVIPGSAYTQSASLSGNLVRAGLNFKFGEPVVPPVVARY